jgi:hypothetical protein
VNNNSAPSYIHAGQAYFAVAASAFRPVNVVADVREIHPGTWTHVAFTWDGTTRKLYVDGVLDGEDVPTGNVSRQMLAQIVGQLRPYFEVLNYPT